MVYIIYEIHFHAIYRWFSILHTPHNCKISPLCGLCNGNRKHAGSEALACLSPTIAFLAAAFHFTLASMPRSRRHNGAD
jgi:hypothetical protein